MPQQTYWKVPFEWTATTPPPDDALPAGWSWRDGTTLAAPVGLVGEVLANSPGPEDRRAVDQLGADEAARRLVALAPGFSYLPSCWHVLMVRRSMAGFVLPVIYDGCARDGLDEATIYHMSRPHIAVRASDDSYCATPRRLLSTTASGGRTAIRLRITTR